MHCEQCETLLPLLVFEEIEDGDKAMVLEHLSSCGSCSEKLGDLRVTFNLLHEGIAAGTAPMLASARREQLLLALAREPAKPKKTKRKSKNKNVATVKSFRLFTGGSPARRLLAIAATLAISVALVGLLLPGMGSARRTSRRMQSGTQARGIQQGLVLESQSRGKYAKDLVDLVDKNYIDPQYLIHPEDNVRVPSDFESWSREKKSGWISENSGYTFVQPGSEETNDSRRVVVFEKPRPGAQGVNIVYDDNHVEFKSLAEAEKEIRESTGKSMSEWSESMAFGAKLNKARDTVSPPRPAFMDHANVDDFAGMQQSPPAQGQTYNTPVPPPVVQSGKRPSDALQVDGSESAPWSSRPASPPPAPASAAAPGEGRFHQSPGGEALLGGAPRGSVALKPTGSGPVSGSPANEAARRSGAKGRDGDIDGAPHADGRADRLAMLDDQRDEQRYEFRSGYKRDSKEAMRDPSETREEFYSLQLPEILEEKIDKQARLERLPTDDSGRFKNSEREENSKSLAGNDIATREETPGGDPSRGSVVQALDLSIALDGTSTKPSGAEGSSSGPEVHPGASKDNGTVPAKEMVPFPADWPELTARRLENVPQTEDKLFRGAPEFDLNAAVDNSKVAGKGASGPKSATTLFAESEESPEQATREEKIEQLATLIQDTVGEQHTWAAYGGEVSTLRELDGKLIIKGTPSQHRQITQLLTQLRDDQTDKTGGVIHLNNESAADSAVTQKLQQRVTLVVEGKQLDQAVRELQEKTGSNVAVNWQALEAAGVERDQPVSLRLTEVPAEVALKLLVNQAGAGAQLEPIDYEVINGVINISTRRDLNKNTAVQVYDVRDLLNLPLKPADAQALATQLKEDQEREKQALAKQLEEARLANEKAKAAQLQRQQSPAPSAQDEGELQPAASFRVVPVNPWTLTQNDAQSTFALDVDTASYTLGRRYLQRGYLPPQGSVRMEEYINAFDYNYVNQSEKVFRIFVDAAPAPFAVAGEHDTKLVKVGIKGKVIGRDGRKPANLILVVDTSGSMARADRLPLVQHALELLTEQLSPNDTISLVTFGSQVLTLLDRTPASNKQQIITAIRSLQSNGPTNLLKGVEAGYKLAEAAHKSGAINRVILCSDGIATLGETEADTILKYVDKYRKQGISCTTVGVGAGAYDDDMMEKLANRGDGMYYFIDSPREARRVFVDELTATLQTIAKDAKIQVEFNPQRVRRYRLIGYENRAVADKDFRNDTIDAGEVGSGQSSTALYEVELIGEERADLGTVYVRYRHADTHQIEEISHRLTASLVRDRTPQSDPRFYLAACAAEFAEILRGSEHATGGSFAQVQAMLEQVVPHLPLDEKAQELLNLVRTAQGLPRAP